MRIIIIFVTVRVVIVSIRLLTINIAIWSYLLETEEVMIIIFSLHSCHYSSYL